MASTRGANLYDIRRKPFRRATNWSKAGADPACNPRGGGGRFQYYSVVKSHFGKYTPQHCCDKTMDGIVVLSCEQ